MTADHEPVYARADAVAGLASELEVLRRAVDPLTQLSGRVEDLARLVTALADDLAAHLARGGPPVAPSWLTAPASRDDLRQLLSELAVWMSAVYLRYADARAALPECWLWHPDVVEELLWLMHAWLAAYQGPAASVALAGDWHDRYRPGVVRRIRAVAGMCSLENHLRRDDRPAAGVPVVEATDLIVSWWAAGRDEPAPEPGPEQLAAAAAPRHWRGGVRR